MAALNSQISTKKMRLATDVRKSTISAFSGPTINSVSKLKQIMTPSESNLWQVMILDLSMRDPSGSGLSWTTLSRQMELRWWSEPRWCEPQLTTLFKALLDSTTARCFHLSEQLNGWWLTASLKTMAFMTSNSTRSYSEKLADSKHLVNIHQANYYLELSWGFGVLGKKSNRVGCPCILPYI